MQTGRTTPNNKPEITIHDNEQGKCMLIDVAYSGDRNVIKKESEKILKHVELTLYIQRMWNVRNKSDSSNNTSNWNHFKTFHKIPGQHTGKA